MYVYALWHFYNLNDSSKLNISTALTKREVAGTSLFTCAYPEQTRYRLILITLTDLVVSVSVRVQKEGV